MTADEAQNSPTIKPRTEGFRPVGTRVAAEVFEHSLRQARLD
jgi:hypothetical protein